MRNPLVLWSYCAFYADHPIVLNSAIRLIPEFDDCPLRRFHLKQLATVDLIHNLSIMQNEIRNILCLQRTARRLHVFHPKAQMRKPCVAAVDRVKCLIALGRLQLNRKAVFLQLCVIGSAMKSRSFFHNFHIQQITVKAQRFLIRICLNANVMKDDFGHGFCPPINCDFAPDSCHIVRFGKRTGASFRKNWFNIILRHTMHVNSVKRQYPRPPCLLSIESLFPASIWFFWQAGADCSCSRFQWVQSMRRHVETPKSVSRSGSGVHFSYLFPFSNSSRSLASALDSNLDT